MVATANVYMRRGALPRGRRFLASHGADILRTNSLKPATGKTQPVRQSREPSSYVNAT